MAHSCERRVSVALGNPSAQIVAESCPTPQAPQVWAPSGSVALQDQQRVMPAFKRTPRALPPRDPPP